MSKNAITIKVPTGKTSVIALKSGTSSGILAHGTTVKSVMDKARKSGVDDPILMFVPKKGHRYVY
jgi:hypothetical protein